MPKQEGQKSKLLTLLRILEQKTDEEHLLNVPQLVELLEQQDILADSAKYDRRAFASVFPPEKTCRMITTSGAPQKYLDFYARQGIPCTVLPFE